MFLRSGVAHVIHFTHPPIHGCAPLQIVLYQADWERNMPWNLMAAGMADVVLLVANAEVSRRLCGPPS